MCLLSGTLALAFSCSYLANDMEEDVDDYKLTIVPYALVDARSHWTFAQYKRMLALRDRLFARMRYCAFVHHCAVEQVCASWSNHGITSSQFSCKPLHHSY